MIVSNTISDFGEFGVLYGNFYAPSLDLEVTELFGRAANLLTSRAHKPTDEDMGPHNWGGGEARPKGGMRGRGRRR